MVPCDPDGAAHLNPSWNEFQMESFRTTNNLVSFTPFKEPLKTSTNLLSSVRVWLTL